MDNPLFFNIYLKSHMTNFNPHTYIICDQRTVSEVLFQSTQVVTFNNRKNQRPKHFNPSTYTSCDYCRF